MSSGGNISQFIQEKSKFTGIYDILAHHSQRWVSHLNRLEDNRVPKQILYLSHKTGRPKNRYKDIIKRNLEVINIPLENWQYMSKNWSQKISRASSSDMMNSTSITILR